MSMRAPDVLVFQMGDVWAWFVRADVVGDDEDNFTHPFDTKEEALSDLEIFLVDRVGSEEAKSLMKGVSKHEP